MPREVHNEKVKDEVYECTIFFNQTAVVLNCLRLKLTFIITMAIIIRTIQTTE
jgi:hypothetical protein